jgi:hypothetical protein
LKELWRKINDNAHCVQPTQGSCACGKDDSRASPLSPLRLTPPHTHTRMCSLCQHDATQLVYTHKDSHLHLYPVPGLLTVSVLACDLWWRPPPASLQNMWLFPQKPLTSRYLLSWSTNHSQPTHHHPSPSYPVRRPFAVAVLACDVAWSHRQPVSWCYCHSWCGWWVAEQQIQLGTAAQLTRRVADSKHPAGGRGEGRKDEQIV